MELRPIRIYSVSQQALDMRNEGRSMDEICERFDKTKDEVNSMLSRARQQRARRHAAK